MPLPERNGSNDGPKSGDGATSQDRTAIIHMLAYIRLSLAETDVFGANLVGLAIEHLIEQEERAPSDRPGKS